MGRRSQERYLKDTIIYNCAQRHNLPKQKDDPVLIKNVCPAKLADCEIFTIGLPTFPILTICNM